MTKGLILNGGEKWTPTSYIHLVQDYGLDTEVNRTEKIKDFYIDFLNFKKTCNRLLFIFQIHMVIKLVK